MLPLGASVSDGFMQFPLVDAREFIHERFTTPYATKKPRESSQGPERSGPALLSFPKQKGGEQCRREKRT